MQFLYRQSIWQCARIPDLQSVTKQHYLNASITCIISKVNFAYLARLVLFLRKLEDTFARCEKYSSKLDIYHSLIRIFVIYEQLFLFQQGATTGNNPIPVNNYCHCCVQMGFIIKRYERRFQYTRQEQRQGV